jgi:SAM-dependent methyltransferase
MQKEFYLDGNPRCEIWDKMWTARTIEQELEACDLETPPRELFLSYLSKKDKIVDAGCGFAKWVIYLHRRGYDIVGIDNNEFAISRLKEFDETLQVEAGDIVNIQYPDNHFSGYISMGVVEHFEEGPQAPLNEAFRLLKPGGLIFVSVPTVNLIRRLIRRPMRTCINSLFILKAFGKKSPTKAILAAMANLFPEKIKKDMAVMQGIYSHFTEYRYTRSELENFLVQSGFEVIETRAHDIYDSKDHAVGLWVDFPFFRAGNWDNFRLNSIGKLISQILDGISPWIASSSVICVARSLKKPS